MLLPRVSELENQIGAGLIEEVIQVAEGELALVDTMLEAKVYVLLIPHTRTTKLTSSHRWEELQEKSPAGQWDYFARDQHTPGTQEPPTL